MNLTGVQLIAAERQDQIGKHGRTIQYDASHNQSGQLGAAASLLSQNHQFDVQANLRMLCPINWDYAAWSKLIAKPHKERLIIAGALIAAEIDRLSLIENPEYFKPKTEVYSQSDCTYKYCPHPDICKGKGKCIYSKIL